MWRGAVVIVALAGVLCSGCTRTCRCEILMTTASDTPPAVVAVAEDSTTSAIGEAAGNAALSALGAVGQAALDAVLGALF